MRPLEYWSSQAGAYLPPFGSGFVRFTARHQQAAVLKLLAPRGGERVLDAGCGTGLLTTLLAARGARVWAVDFCPEMVREVTGAERVVCADLQTLELGTVFDAVVCAGALNFVDAARAISRLAAHTRPGGMLVVLVTRPSIAGFCYALSRWLLGVRFRIHSERWLSTCAAENGLELVARESTLPHDVALAFLRSSSDGLRS